MPLTLVCPFCGNTLNHKTDSYFCPRCQKNFDIIAGVPDLRIFDPPYISREKERERIELLMSRFHELEWEELVRFYVYGVERHSTEAARQKDWRHRLTLRKRAQQRQQDSTVMLQQISYALPSHSCVLDLGCGSGEAIPVFFKQGAHQVVGLDISYEELILAKKLCLEKDIASAFFVAGNAEALPFPAASFDFIYAMDIIEHVADQQKYVAEAERVLCNNGGLFFNSPNRFCLLAPEPHVGLWGMGFLPRFLMDPYCRLRGKGPYIGKRLLSYWELKRKLSKFFPKYHLFERKPNPRAETVAGKLYKSFAPVSVQAHTLITELHTVFAQKDK